MNLSIEELRLIDYVHPLISQYEKTLRTRRLTHIMGSGPISRFHQAFQTCQDSIKSNRFCHFFGLNIFSLFFLASILGAWVYFAVGFLTFDKNYVGRDPEMGPVFIQAPWIFLLASLCFFSCLHIKKNWSFLLFIIILFHPWLVLLIVWVATYYISSGDYHILAWCIGVASIAAYCISTFLLNKIFTRCMSAFWSAATLVAVHCFCVAPICRNMGLYYLMGTIRSHYWWFDSLKLLIFPADALLIVIWFFATHEQFFLSENSLCLVIDKMRSKYLKSYPYRLYMANFSKFPPLIHRLFSYFDIVAFVAPLVPLLCSQTVFFILLFDKLGHGGLSFHAADSLYFTMTIATPVFSVVTGTAIVTANIKTSSRIFLTTFLLMIPSIGGTITFALNKQDVQGEFLNGFYEIVVHPLLLAIIHSFMSSFPIEKRKEAMVLLSFASFSVNFALFLMGLSDKIGSQIPFNIAIAFYILAAVLIQPFICIQLVNYFGAICSRNSHKSNLVLRNNLKDIRIFGFLFNSIAFCIVHTLITYNYLPKFKTISFSMPRQSFYMSIIVLLPVFWICLHFALTAKFPQNVKKHIMANVLALESIVKGKSRKTVANYRLYQSTQRIILILTFITSVPLIVLFVIWDLVETDIDTPWIHYFLFLGGLDIIIGLGFYLLIRVKHFIGINHKVVFPILIISVWLFILIPVFTVYPLVGLLYKESTPSRFNKFQMWSMFVGGVILLLLVLLTSVFTYGALYDVHTEPKMRFLIHQLLEVLKENHVEGDSNIIRMVIKSFEKKKGAKKKLEEDLLQNNPIGWVPIGKQYPDLEVAQVLVPRSFFFHGIKPKGKILKSKNILYYWFFGEPEDNIQHQEELKEERLVLEEQQKLKEKIQPKVEASHYSEYFGDFTQRALEDLGQTPSKESMPSEDQIKESEPVHQDQVKEVYFRQEEQTKEREIKEEKNEFNADVSVDESVPNHPRISLFNSEILIEMRSKFDRTNRGVHMGPQMFQSPSHMKTEHYMPSGNPEIKMDEVEKENFGSSEVLLIKKENEGEKRTKNNKEDLAVVQQMPSVSANLVRIVQNNKFSLFPDNISDEETEDSLSFLSKESDYYILRSIKTRLLKKIDPCPWPEYSRVWQSPHGKLMLGSHLFRAEFIFKLFQIFASEDPSSSEPSIIYIDFLELFRMVVWKSRFMQYMKEHVSFWNVYISHASVKRKIKGTNVHYYALSFKEFKMALFSISQLVYMNEPLERSHKKLIKKIYAEFMELSEINGFLDVYHSDEFLEELRKRMAQKDLEEVEKQFEEEANQKLIEFEDDDTEEVATKEFMDILFFKVEKNYKAYKHAQTKWYLLLTRFVGRFSHRLFRLFCVDLFEKLPLKIKKFFSYFRKKNPRAIKSAQESNEELRSLLRMDSTSRKKSFASSDTPKNKITIRSSNFISRMDSENQEGKGKRKVAPKWPLFVGRLLKRLNEENQIYLKQTKQVQIMVFNSTNILLYISKFYEFGFLIYLVFSNLVPWFETETIQALYLKSLFSVYTVGYIFAIAMSLLLIILSVVSIPDILNGTVGRSSSGSIIKFPHPKFFFSGLINIVAGGLFTTFIRELIFIFNCTISPSGVFLLAVNQSTECYQDLHYGLSIAAILCLIVVYPCAVLIYPNFQYMDGSLNFKFEPIYLAIAIQVKTVIIGLHVFLYSSEVKQFGNTSISLLISALLYLSLAILDLWWKPTVIKSSSLFEGFGLLACSWANFMALLLFLTKESWICLGLLIGGISLLVFLWFILLIRGLVLERKQLKKEPTMSMLSDGSTGQSKGTEEDGPLRREQAENELKELELGKVEPKQKESIVEENSKKDSGEEEKQEAENNEGKERKENESARSRGKSDQEKVSERDLSFDLIHT